MAAGYTRLKLAAGSLVSASTVACCDRPTASPPAAVHRVS
jgi:hypothetical protein